MKGINLLNKYAVMKTLRGCVYTVQVHWNSAVFPVQCSNGIGYIKCS